mmetsp:Transcript_6766/g.16539  ORF Transcript_6766/g.16539 Transcript_6766/m.16539 type:complete len:208 (-) Transcript_6766:118-741(-)
MASDFICEFLPAVLHAGAVMGRIITSSDSMPLAESPHSALNFLRYVLIRSRLNRPSFCFRLSSKPIFIFSTSVTTFAVRRCAAAETLRGWTGPLPSLPFSPAPPALFALPRLPPLVGENLGTCMAAGESAAPAPGGGESERKRLLSTEKRRSLSPGLLVFEATTSSPRYLRRIEALTFFFRVDGSPSCIFAVSPIRAPPRLADWRMF